MDRHVRDAHLANEDEEVKYSCTKCGHDFKEVENYNAHVKMHEVPCSVKLVSKDTEITILENLIYCEILECFVGSLHPVDDKQQSVDVSTKMNEKLDEMNTIISFPCESCKYLARSKEWLETHKRTKHGASPLITPAFDDLVELTCRQCVFEAESKGEIDNHMSKTHNRTTQLQCTKCEYKTRSKPDLEEHVQTLHMVLKVNIQTNDQIVLSCELCGYKCRYNIQLKKHMKSQHEEQNTKMEKYKCVMCEFTANFLLDLWQHRQTTHADSIPEFLPQSKSKEDVAFAYLAEMSMELMEEMETLKKDFKGAFVAYANEMETELKAVRDEATANNNTVCAAIAALGKQLESSRQKEQHPPHAPSNTPTASPSSSSKEVPKAPNRQPKSKKRKSLYLQKQKILYIGDSVA